MWLQGFDEIRIELGDEGEVRFLLLGRVEDLPGKVVDVPGVDEVDVRETERKCALGLRKGRDMEVGS